MSNEMEENAAMPNYVISTFNVLAKTIYFANRDKGFWPGPDETEEYMDLVYATKLALINTETAELTEAHRFLTPRLSEKIPGFSLKEEEAADIIIRVLDLCGEQRLRIGEAIIAKLKHNREQRPYKHGKRF